MARLVALDLPGGPTFVAVLRRTWDEGDAVLVLDRRTTDEARAALARQAGAHVVVGADGTEAPGPAPGPSLDDEDRLVVATSGSTGAPKLVVHTDAGLRAHAAAVHARLGVAPDRDRWLACLPLDHLGGFGVVARSLLTATPVDVVDGFDRRTVAAAPAQLGSTLVSLVPTALDRLAEDAVARFRRIVLGGAADPVDRPGNVVRTYGSTETGGGVVYDGRPLDAVEVAVDGEGRIALRGPSLARGLRGADGAVAALVDADGWLRTGDLGELGPDGRLVVHGRADALIITGGENVWPGPVERALATHPAVAEVVVMGEPDPEWGQRVVAVVVPVDPADPPALEALRAHAADAGLPPAARPRQVRVVASIPRSSLGKPRRS
ncbi:MAG: AMP-binding protein [Acidimicrobiales bacterium]